LSLRDFIKKIQIELLKKTDLKNDIQGNLRKITRLSKQAILFIHQERFDDAKTCLVDAKTLFDEVYDLTIDFPDLLYSGLADAAYEEYAEAKTYLRLVDDGEFMNPEEIVVPSVSYVLGLSDVIGELRRRALDSIRRDKIDSANLCLKLMEEIFIEITAMDEAYMLVPGLRRKCDVARRIIEATRGDVTLEVRRRSLEQAINRLDSVLGDN
jgi:translin